MRPVVWMSLLLALLSLALPARAEDGHELWLRYRPVEAPALDAYRAATTALLPGGDSATIRAATAELERGLDGLTGRRPAVVSAPERGVILYGTPATSPLIAELDLPLSEQGDEGYLIRSVRLDGRPATVIAANADIGVLYGVFDLLRRIQTRQPLTGLDVRASVTAAWTSIANVGPVFGSGGGPTGAVIGFPEASKWVMIAGMLIGRLELLTVYVLFMPRFWRS